jgi:hypothetical protein
LAPAEQGSSKVKVILTLLLLIYSSSTTG